MPHYKTREVHPKKHINRIDVLLDQRTSYHTDLEGFNRATNEKKRGAFTAELESVSSSDEEQIISTAYSE
jgi:hypothetical protein